MGGTNDVWLDLPFNLILSNTKAMIRHAESTGAIAFLGMPTPCFMKEEEAQNAPFLTGKNFEERIRAYRSYLWQAIRFQGLPIIDFGISLNAESFLPDGVHPNETGHKIMGRNAARSVDSYLNSIPG